MWFLEGGCFLHLVPVALASPMLPGDCVALAVRKQASESRDLRSGLTALSLGFHIYQVGLIVLGWQNRCKEHTSRLFVIRTIC